MGVELAEQMISQYGSALPLVAVAVKLNTAPALVGVVVADAGDSCTPTVHVGGVFKTLTEVETGVACALGINNSKYAPKLVTTTSATESMAATVIFPPLLYRVEKELGNQRRNA